MKKILSITVMIMLVFAFGKTDAQFMSNPNAVGQKSILNPNDDLAILGYCGDVVDPKNGIGTDNPSASFSAAIMIPASQMAQYVGKTIKKIRVGVAQVPVSDFRVWISATKDGERIVQESSTAEVGWNDVFFSSAYSITGDAIWIGYDLTCSDAAKFPLALDGTIATNSNGNWVAISGNWDHLPTTLKGVWSIRGIVDDGVATEYDLQLRSINVPGYAKVNTPFDIKGDIYNNGTVEITSFDASYKVNGGEIITKNITGLSIKQGKKYQFVTNPVTLTATGLTQIEVSVGNINGNTDAYLDDNTLSGEVFVVENDSDIVKRIPILESFSSSTCGPCVAGNVNTKKVLERFQGEATLIKYQVQFPGKGDPYYTAEVGVRGVFYGVNSVPWMQVDGSEWTGNSGSLTLPVLENLAEIPSFVAMSGEFKLDDKTVSTTITMKPNKPIIGGNNIRLFAAIVEKTTINNKKSNGEKIFYQVMKKMLPDASGTPMGDLSANETVTKELSFEFKGDYRLPKDATSPINHKTENSVEDFNNLEVVYWLQNTKTKEILQSGTAKNAILSIDNVDELNVIVYPNPAKDYITVKGEYNTLSIVDITGKVVKTVTGQSNIDVNDLNNGIYILNIVSDGTTKTQKIMISK